MKGVPKMDGLHVCSVSGCTWASERRLFTCMTHWLKVPVILQERVWAAYRSLPQKMPDRGVLLSDPAYCSAAAAVIDHLAALESRPATSVWHVALGNLEDQIAEREEAVHG